MKFQYLNGGLGNQLFQYIFYRYYQLHARDEIWLDDMKFFFVHEHNGYELARIFGLKPNLVSNYFDPDVWEYMVSQARQGGDLCQQLYDNGIDITMVAETTNFVFNGPVRYVATNNFHPILAGLPGNIYFFGYWINREWLAAIRETIMAELVFPPVTERENLAYEQIAKTEKSVSVHIRRGDFCRLGLALEEEFYREAMDLIIKYLPDATYLVFSDDIGWCKDNYRTLGLDLAGDRIDFVSGNEGEKSYIDMYLMSLCHGMILANSAFSYFAALYNSHPDRVVINPTSFREV